MYKVYHAEDSTPPKGFLPQWILILREDRGNAVEKAYRECCKGEN